MTSASSPHAVTVRRVRNVEVVAEERRFASGTPGIDLFVRTRRPAAMRQFTAASTIVMVHGATFSSGSLYDVPLGGFSFLDYLAVAGYDVHAMDVRGFGRSSTPQQMDSDALIERAVATLKSESTFHWTK